MALVVSVSLVDCSYLAAEVHSQVSSERRICGCARFVCFLKRLAIYQTSWRRRQDPEVSSLAELLKCKVEPMYRVPPTRVLIDVSRWQTYQDDVSAAALFATKLNGF